MVNNRQEYNKEKVFQDISKTGKDRKWRERKLDNLNLAKAYRQLNYRSTLIQTVSQCAEVLTFLVDELGQLRLNQTWFCKNKLCSICNWRRSMKYSYQTSCVLEEAIKRYPKARFLFLTLTIQNVRGEELNGTLSDLTKSFHRLFGRVKVKKNLLGFLRATEVTVEEKRQGYYHPHLHVLLMVKANYFKGGQYISQEEWTDMWQASANLSYIPIVNIKTIKNKDTGLFDKEGLKHAILETAKYPVKPIKFDDNNLQVVEDLYNGLYRKRQLAYGGILKNIKAELKLDDVENGDLIKVDEDTGEVTNGTKLVAFWNWERKNYYIK